MENGAAVAFRAGEASMNHRVETGRVLVDGKGVGDVGGLVLRDRRHLSEDGMVITSLVINKETQEIPEILDGAKCVVLETIDKQLADGFELDCTMLQMEIRRELKRFFHQVLNRRPVIYPIVVEI